MYRMHNQLQSINRSDTGLALIPRDQSPRLRNRYLDRLNTPQAPLGVSYVHGFHWQIDELLRRERFCAEVQR